jgi:hypothetical protein
VEVEFGAAAATSLEIEIEDVADGDYEVWIGEMPRAVLTVAAGHGRVRWDTSPQMERGELPLDFATAGLPVNIRQGEAVFFTGTVPAAGPGVSDGDGDNDSLPPPGTVTLTRTAAAPATATAEAEVGFGAAGVAGLEVELEHLPDGDYEVLIGGTVRGFLTVMTGKGTARWDTEPQTGRGDLLLDFAAAGMTVAVRQGGTVLFSGNLPAPP